MKTVCCVAGLFFLLGCAIGDENANANDWSHFVARKALRMAIDVVDRTNEESKEQASGTFHSQSQKADDDSIDAQRDGDIIQEATSIIVKEYGADALEQLAEVNVPSLIADLEAEKSASSNFSNNSILSSLSSFAGRIFGRHQGGHRGGRGGRGGNRGGKQGRNVNEELDTIVSSQCLPKGACFMKSHRYRTTSGYCNNLSNPKQASTLTELRRLHRRPSYDDRFSAVRNRSADGGMLPSTRLISNKIHAEATVPVFDPKHSHLFMQMGQFIAHDVIFIPAAVGKGGSTLDCTACDSGKTNPNCAPIPVPDDDEYFPKGSCIRFTRAINGQTGFGNRMQINQNSHLLDLSMVYGSSDCVSDSLRTLTGGKMKMYTDNGYVLPPQTYNDTNCLSAPSNYCFLAGDSRNSLHPGLIPMHTLFLRAHNKMAEEIAGLRPKWDDEKIYQETRRLLIAMWQHVVYSEYLPKVIGEKMMKQFKLDEKSPRDLHDKNVDPSVSMEFATAAFRFGHSQVRKDIPRANNKNSSMGSYVDLGKNIFYSDSLYQKDADVFSMAEGMTSHPAMAVDRQFSFPVRNQLFETRNKKASGVDLVAMNIMRGRDVGIPPYNTLRETLGLHKARSFDDLKDISPENIALLKTVYKSVDDVDLYTGILLEKPADPTAVIGPTGSHIIADQFHAWMYGDSRFYQHKGILTNDEYAAVRNTELAQLMCSNVIGMTMVPTDPLTLGSKQVECSSLKPIDLSKILIA